MSSLKFNCFNFVLIIASTCLLSAAWVERTVEYKLDEELFSGVLVFDESISEPVPAVFMIPNWMGVTDAAVQKAKYLAGDQYVFFVADMYGATIRPKDASEAGKAAGLVRADRPLMRKRAQLALNTMLEEVKAPIDTSRTAAIGFCFGGGTVFELGRSGVDLDAIVSFHGDLMSPTLSADAGSTLASMLVLHGADDPYVPQSDVDAFIQAMQQTKCDWQLVQYSETVHSFTDPSAASAGRADYNPLSAKRAFGAMSALFEELF